MMTTKEPFTTSGPYRRNRAHDRRLAHGDSFTGDCWEARGGVRFWVAVGVDPNGTIYTFEPCPRCDGAGWVREPNAWAD